MLTLSIFKKLREVNRGGRVEKFLDKKFIKILHQLHIIGEDLETKIKQVAEGVVSLNEKMDRRFDEMNRNIE